MTYDRAEDLLAFIAELGEDNAPPDDKLNGHVVNRIAAYDSPQAIVERAAKYIAKMPIAVDGSNGSKDCFKVACVCVKGFLLSTDDALDAMRDWNANCQPPWTEHELRHKLSDAAKASGPSGYLVKTQETNWPSVKVPDYVEPKQTKRTKPEPQTTRTTLREAAKKHLETIQAGEQQLIKTGIPELDYAIGGGMGFGEIVLIAARPSHGKSAIALQILNNVTATGMPCVFCSEEMSAQSLGKRATQSITSIPQERWFAMNSVVGTHIDDYFKDRAECWIIEHNRTADKVAEAICKHAKEDGVKVAVVDYVQLLSNSKGSRYETVTESSVVLKQAATESGVTLISLAQMSRSIEGRDKFVPKVSDLRESGQLEQDADIILFLVWPHRIDGTLPPDEYQIYVSKNRNREIVRYSVDLKFEPSRQRLVSREDRFTELAESFK
jgi:replicative DNA helicase